MCEWIDEQWTHRHEKDNKRKGINISLFDNWHNGVLISPTKNNQNTEIPLSSTANQLKLIRQIIINVNINNEYQ